MRATMSFVTSLGAFAPGIEHRADHQVGVHDGAVEVERVGGGRLDAPLEVIVEVPQALHVRVEDRDVGTEARPR